jgi:uncharacterized membrane protein YsdA (DUF1294 family)
MLLVVYFLLCVNVLGVLLVAWDKAMSKLSMSRVPEKSILMVYLAGGWIGGLLSQYLFSHKTKKESFKSKAKVAIVSSVLICLAVLWVSLEGEIRG